RRRKRCGSTGLIYPLDVIELDTAAEPEAVIAKDVHGIILNVAIVGIASLILERAHRVGQSESARGRENEVIRNIAAREERFAVLESAAHLIREAAGERSLIR